MKLWSSSSFSGVKDLEDLVKRVTSSFKNLGLLLKNNVTFIDNMKCEIVDFYFENNSDNFQISHGLGVVPIGVMVVKKSRTNTVPGDIYWSQVDGVPAWTDKVIFLRSENSQVSARLIIIGA